MVWEIALLVDVGRLSLDVAVETWVERFLDCPGIEAVPLDHATAASSHQFHHFAQRDPADRLLMATAVGYACPLVTYDRQIVRFAERYGAQYNLSVQF